MNKTFKYQRPKIKVKKIKINFFLTSIHIPNNLQDFLVPNVYAQVGDVSRLPNTGGGPPAACFDNPCRTDIVCPPPPGGC